MHGQQQHQVRNWCHGRLTPEVGDARSHLSEASAAPPMHTHNLGNSTDAHPTSAARYTTKVGSGHALPKRRDQHRRAFDLAGAVLPNQLPGLLQIADPRKLFYGSDYPFTPAPVAAKYGQMLEATDVFEEHNKKHVLEGAAWSLSTGQ